MVGLLYDMVVALGLGDGYLGVCGLARVAAACRTFAQSSPSFRLFGVVVSKMVSQASAADLSAASPVVSPTARLVAGTSVVATFLRPGPSSIASHAIPGLSAGAGEYASFCFNGCQWFLWVLRSISFVLGSCFF